MIKNEIMNCYRGFLTDTKVEEHLHAFFNILSNNKKKKVLSNTNLIVVADTRDRALLFAKDTVHALSKLKLASDCKELTSKEFHETLDDVLIVDDFTNDSNWNEIKTKLYDIHQIIIFCTSTTNQKRYMKDANNYYALFPTQIVLEPYCLEEIKSGAKFFFEQLATTKEITYNDSFFPALEEYIDTVYPRASLKGEAFVYDLKERFLRESYATEHPRNFTADTIPSYFKKESIEAVEKAMREDFCYSTCVEKVIRDVEDSHKASLLNLSSYKPTLNMNLYSEFGSLVEQFARQYGALLNTKEINAISAKDVLSMTPYEFMWERENLHNKHGVILLRDFDRFSEIENADEVIQYLIDEIDNGENDLVWVLAGKTDFYHCFNEINRTKLEFLFRNQYSLDEHDENSSVKLIESIFRRNELECTKDDIDAIKAGVLESKTMLEAINQIETYVAQNINNIHKKEEKKTRPFDNVIRKENELRGIVSHVPESKDEVNVLLLAMSTLPKRMSFSTYQYRTKDEMISGQYVSQLEPVPKVLAEILGKTNRKLDEIIVLNTTETLKEADVPADFKEGESDYSAYTYFIERCNCIVDQSHVRSIDLETEDKKKQLGKAIYLFSKALVDFSAGNKKVNLYVDIHGGLRDAAIIVDALVMLIKEIPHIELKDIFHVTYNSPLPAQVASILNDFKVFDFVSGMNEFLSFGRSNGLIKFNENTDNHANQNLVDTINTISDNIILDRMEQFSENLKQLSSIVNKEDSQEGYFDTVKSLIRGNYEVVISGTQYDLLTNGNSYFPAELQWCVNKKLIQQALVLIESNTGEFLKNEHILLPDPYKNIEDVLGDWAKYSLCTQKWKDEEASTDKKVFVKRDWKKDYYYKEYVQDFNNISILEICETNSEQLWYKKVALEIDKLKNNNKQYNYKKYNQVLPSRLPNGVKIKYFSAKTEKSSIKYESEEKNIPINKILVNDKYFMDMFYQFLYLYKALKKYRNDVAHPKNNYKNKKTLSEKEIELWIQVYIQLFDNLIELSRNLLKQSAQVSQETNKVKNPRKEIEVKEEASSADLEKYASLVNQKHSH